MKRTKTTNKESLQVILMDCIAAGVWYWFRAEGDDENMASALNRMKYRGMIQRLEALNIPCPTPDEIYAYAAEKWPMHKLHPAPKAA
jgi:hypothetical protein